MMKINKKHLVIFFLVFFIFAHKASASDIIIDEFLSHPNTDGQEWIELYNKTSDPINLTGWKLTELSSPNTDSQKENDLLSLDGIINSNSVIIFDVGKSKLNDGGDSIGLYNGSNLIDRVTYGTESTVINYSIDLPISTIGKSGALISGKWYNNQDPTPGEPNAISSTGDTADVSDDTDSISDSSSGSTSSTSSSSTNTEPIKIYKITTKIIAPKVVTAGVPFLIDHQTFGIHKEKVIFGNFVWNFGDGMSKANKTSDPFSYTYEYPGDYVLTLSFYTSTFNTEPDAIDRINVKVIPSGVVISSVGTPSDPFIEIENNSSYEMSLRGWIAKGSVHAFMIPENTVILPNKKLKLSPKITGFDFGDLSSVSIIDTSGQIFATYPNKILPQLKYISSTTVANSVKSDTAKISNVENIPEVINLNDLGASAGDSNVANNINKGLYFWLGLALIIFIGLAGVIFLRRKNDYPDYVEGELTAKDMTIIE